MACSDAVQQACRSFVMGDAPGDEWQGLLWLEARSAGQDRRCGGRDAAAERTHASPAGLGDARSTIGNGGCDIGAGPMTGDRETFRDQDFIGFRNDAARDLPLCRCKARRGQPLSGRESSARDRISEREVELSRQWRGRRWINCGPKPCGRAFASPLQCHVCLPSGPFGISRVDLSREPELHL